MILVCVVFAGAVQWLALDGLAYYLTRLRFTMLHWTWAKAKVKHGNTHNLWNTCSSLWVRPIDEHLAARAAAGCIVDVGGCIGWLPILARGLARCEKYI